MPQLKSKTYITSSTQVSEGVPTTPPAASAINAFDLSIAYNEIRADIVQLTPDSLATNRPGCNIARTATITFSTYMKSAGSDRTPETGNYLQAAGFTDVTVTPVTSVNYAFQASATTLLTCHIFQDDKILIIYDATVSSINTTLAANALPIDEFTITGRVLSHTFNNSLVSPIFTTAKPQALNGLAISYQGNNVNRVGEVNISLTNEVTEEMSLSSSDGYIPQFITGRSLELTMNPLAEPGAPSPLNWWYDLWAANATGVLVVSAIGSLGNRVEFTMPNAALSSMTESVRGKLLSYDLTFQLNESSGMNNDEISRLYD